MKLFNQLALFFFVFSNVSVTWAQTVPDKATLQCRYLEEFKRWDISTSVNHDEMILNIGSRSSEFYSLWERTFERAVDSVLAKGGSFGEVLNARESVPYQHSYQYFTVYKNFPQKGRLTVSDKLFYYHLYEETLEKPIWTIQMDEKTIIGYRCQKAKTTFRGRTWSVWFTPEIPISDGPWKLCGLPGLILEAVDDKEDFHFTCVAIQQLENPVPIIIPKKKYIKCTRQQFIKDRLLQDEDPDAYLRKIGVEAGESWGADGKPLKRPKRKTCSMEL